MSDTKVYQFGEQGTSSLNALLPFLQQRGIDPAYLAGLMNNNGNNGGFFGNNAWEGIIALIVVAAIFGNNGNGGGLFGGGGNNSNSAEREMLMSAIQRNGTDLSQLAQTIGCSNDRIHDAIGQVSTQICNFAGQNGLSFQQVINSINSGNASIANQICNCCCDLKQLISESNYLTERGFCNTNQIISRGFSDLGYATRDQTCSIEKAIENSTSRVLEGQRNAEMRELQRDLNQRERELAQRDVIINNYQQTQTFGSMITQATQPLAAAINGVQNDIDKIKCKLPETVTIPYIPASGNYLPVNYSIPMHFGVSNYGGCGYNYGC